MTEITLSVDDVEFVKELYPRVREDNAAIERYRAAIDRLPPIVVARGRVLVDGFHRWQAHKRERLNVIAAEDLGNLTDVEILKESIRRNATHGRQLETSDKRRMAGVLWLKGSQDEGELAEILSLTSKSLTEYLRDAKRAEKLARKDEAWDRWLNCEWNSYRQAGEALGIDHKTMAEWVGEKANALDYSPPGSRQHFDVWSFQKADGESSYFGKLPPQVIENLLWLYTNPGQIIVDPFAGGGTVIEVAKRMGRRIWASDRKPSTPTLPIHEHNIADGGWPTDLGAPAKADLVILDPPYWQQAKGRYSDDIDDLANCSLDVFYAAWQAVVKNVIEHTARVAYIISPTQLDDGSVEDHAFTMMLPFGAEGWHVERRIIVPYQTQQATGQQVTWARENKRLLKLYRDLVVMTR